MTVTQPPFVTSISLPSSTLPLIGREDELSDVRTLLTRADTRLISLIGPGGVGKTRLALAALNSSARIFQRHALGHPG
ncbi:MAG: hypothetical protein HC933_20945 [Pleurocapsa sp. SU_196_0]|nr:hypothetical protein [Pleurocapsa sp. SU_196_0]